MEPVRRRMPPRQRAMLVNTRSRDTRRGLIRAALQLWGAGDFEDAYETTTPADIARVAGVSKGTFYFHFANKDELLLEMGVALADTMVAEVDAGIGRGDPLFSLVDQVMTSMARRVARAPKAAAVRSGALGFQNRLRQVPTAGTRGTAGAFEALVRYGRDRGELRADTDVEDAAAMLHTITIEAVMRWGVGDRSASWLRQALRNRAEIVLRGLSPSTLLLASQPGDRRSKHSPG